MRRHPMQMLLVALLAMIATQRGAAQSASRPWFGIQLPPRLGEVPAVVVGARAPRPAIVPAGEESHRELEGRAIRADLETIVNFARDGQTRREIGGGQLWGRISGFP